MQTKRALITGASAGLGAAFARRLAGQGCALVLTARRADRLEALARELVGRHGVEAIALPMDLADPAAPRALFAATEGAGRPVDLLINNAGYALGEGFAGAPWEKQADFLQVLAVAPAELAHRFANAMAARGAGGVLNVASVAGLVAPPPAGGLYSASKAFMVRLSQSLRLEMAGRGVRVAALCPGFTRTEFHAAMGEAETYSKLPGWLWQSADHVVQVGLSGLAAGRGVIVPGAVNHVMLALARFLPDDAVAAITGANLAKARERAP